MCYFAWSSEMETGIELIDAQHQEIIAHVNAVYQAVCLNQRSAEEAAISELMESLESHLRLEEELLEAAAYPKLASHKATHQAFMRRIQRYFGLILDGNEKSLALISDLRMWLTTHIRYDDADYAPHLLQQLAPGSSKKHRQNTSSIGRLFRHA